MYAHKGRTKKLKRHGSHGFALDQPSINGIGPTNRSEKMKRSETSETVGNMIRPKFVEPAFLFKINISAQRSFFFEGPKVSKGKWLETVGDRTFARQKTHVFTQFSNIFHEHVLQNNYFFAERRCDLRLFPTVSPWTPLDLQKKNFVARKCFFTKKCGLDKFWPDHVSDRFRPFPTVSFFLND